MTELSKFPEPSEKLKRTLGSEKTAKMMQRSLTPLEAAFEIKELVNQGWKVNKLAASLGITSTVIKYLNEIARLPEIIDLSLFVSPLWGEKQSDTKRQNQLSFSALGLFASFVNGRFDDADINDALHLIVRLSLSKSDMIEAKHIQKLRKINTATETFQTVADERGGYGQGTFDIVQQAILVSARNITFSEQELQELKNIAEKITGPIASKVFQKGNIIGLEFIPGKLSDAKMDELLPAEKLQSIADQIQEGKNDV